MIKNLLWVLAVAAILFPTHWYVYQRGLRDGEVNYKKSARFFMTLNFAYECGRDDGAKGD
jgi:hypothetical protein